MFSLRLVHVRSFSYSQPSIPHSSSLSHCHTVSAMSIHINSSLSYTHTYTHVHTHMHIPSVLPVVPSSFCWVRMFTPQTHSPVPPSSPAHPHLSLFDITFLTCWRKAPLATSHTHTHTHTHQREKKRKEELMFLMFRTHSLPSPSLALTPSIPPSPPQRSWRT